MATNLWKLFPQILEQKINNLLDTAVPNATKSYQLYKTCKNENLWCNSFEIFSLHLQDYFSLAVRDRAKSYFDCFLDRPMDRHIYESFSLSFRTAQVCPQALSEVADWSHDQMHENSNAPDSAVIATDVLARTLQQLTTPAAHEKDRDIEFEDFCAVWEKTVFYLFGRQYDTELRQILREVRRLHIELKAVEENTRKTESHVCFVPGIYLTQTEIDWTADVQTAAFHYTEMPRFPLTRGPEKLRLIELQRAAELYQLVYRSPRPELQKHRDNIRSTILDKCDRLLKECAR